MILQAFYLPEMRIFVTQNRMSSALFGYNSLLRKVEILRISSFLCSFFIADCALRRIHIRLSVAFDDFCSKSSWPQEELRTKNSAYYSPFYLENIYLTEFLMTQLLLFINSKMRWVFCLNQPLKSFEKNFCLVLPPLSPSDSENARRSSFCFAVRFLGV